MGFFGVKKRHPYPFAHRSYSAKAIIDYRVFSGYEILPCHRIMALPTTSPQNPLIAILFGKPNTEKSVTPNRLLERERYFPKPTIPLFQHPFVSNLPVPLCNTRRAGAH
jgi:hypothetical protein